MKIKDLDHDGHLDVVTANKASGTVAVLRNNGDGSLKAPVYYQTGQQPGHVVLEDLNGDNHLDIITANEGSGDISVFLGRGDGTFQVQKSYVAGSVPGGLAIGDFNRDGRYDLAVTNTSWGSNEVSILFGNGDGTFRVRAVHTVTGSMPSTIKEGDFNNDGILDLAVLSQSGFGWWGSDNAIDLLLGKGDGTFLVSKYALGSTAGGSIQIDYFITDDFNRDGILDIVTIKGGSESALVFIGDGNGKFTQKQFIGGSWPAVSGDIDNDGDTDLLFNLTPWIGQGIGTFEKGGSSVGGKYVLALDLGDIDGDGIMDIVAVEDELKLSVILGKGGGAFQGVAIFHDDDTYGVNSLTTGDFNDDGNQDIAASMSPLEEYSDSIIRTKIVVYWGSGYNTFTKGTVIQSVYYQPWVFSADINGDGKTDIILDAAYMSDDEITVFLNSGDGNFQGAIKYDFESIRTLLEDEIPQRYLYNEGVLATTNVTDNPSAMGRFEGDFNNDGTTDIFITTDDDLSLYLGKGDGTFSPGVRYATGSYSLGYHEYLVRDFNLDGRLDIAVPSYTGLNLLYNTLPPLLTPPSPPTALKGIAGDATVTLSWAANGKEDLGGYNVYRSLSAGGGYVKINSAPLTLPSYTDDSVTNGKTYYYTVSALDEGGEESSNAVKVRAIPHSPDTTPPIVSIISPVNNQTVTNPSLFVSGNINEADARVTVNGMPATVQKNSGTFTACGIPLQAGENTLTVTAVDPAGNTASSSVKVIYTRPAMIEGILRDELTGIAVPNAWIYVRDAMKEQAFLTKPDGTFTFLNVMPGEITITAYGGDYDTLKVDKTIAPGENLILDIPLPLYPASIRAWIYDSHTSNRVAMATITITDPKKTQTLTANDYGQFESSNISPYQITITISSAGYQTHTEMVNVTNRWTNYLYFYLDPLPPSPPSGFTATPGKGFVNLAWDANSESNIANYQISRSTTPGANYQLIGSTNNNETSYADGDVLTGTAYYYMIKAVNTSAQPSGYSAEVSAVPEALQAPTGLTATPGRKVVNLAWEAIAENHVSSYNIYRTAETDGDYALIGSVAAPTASYADNQVDAGVTHTYVVTAVNAWSRESDRSNQAAAMPEAVSVGVAITSPANGAYSATSTVLVKGTVESGTSPEVGVVLVVESRSREGILTSSYLAEVNNGSFAAQISLFPGIQNTIRAIATLPEGEQATTAIILYADAAEEAVKLSALPSNGILSAQTRTFDMGFEAEVNITGTIVNYSWDFDGDGSIDQVTSTPAATFGYTRPDIFYPTVTVTVMVEAGSGGGVPPKGGENGPSGMSYAATTLVNVMSAEEMNGLFKGKWEGMKGALAQGNIETAVRYFAESSRDIFRQQFTLLSRALPRIIADMGEATLVEVRQSQAICDLRTIRNGSTYSFQLEFIRDGDGLWRIRSF